MAKSEKPSSKASKKNQSAKLKRIPAKRTKQSRQTEAGRKTLAGLAPTGKLGPINPPDPPFTMPVRFPKWHPDRSDAGEPLYIEEAIYSDVKRRNFLPFPVPASNYGGRKVPFREPINENDWSAFNKWILGGSVPSETSTEKPLTTLIRELAVWIRRYNASLYRLRRLHYYYFHRNSPLPPKNPFGDPELPQPFGTGTTAIEILVHDAEEDWKKVIESIEWFIDNAVYGGDDLKIHAADMIEANGYIVSMRIIALPAAEISLLGNKTVFEIGGSSSHISISSAFSSYHYPDDP